MAGILSEEEEKGEERMTTWLSCMSRQLRARGVQ
ncbi:hypothetical protein LCGC14_1623770 [marine sediment metagenome]|uniref:Uncharacterized protein n=1 Tax=marine sediment metagenome TaxID=412755 RepID=A0A0F9I4N7_9ZZZZ